VDLLWKNREGIESCTLPHFVLINSMPYGEKGEICCVKALRF
jgi:hypothetical protein